MNSFDPYAELNVGRDALAPEIKRAYRRRAKKTHSDLPGGSKAAFEATNRALVILTDPRRRKQFDETGRADEPEPDNDRAAALQIINGFIATVVEAFIDRGCVWPDDPRRVDLFAHFRDQTNAQISGMEAELIKGEKIVRFLRDMGDRFTTTEPTNPVARAFALRLEGLERQRASLREAIATGQLALKIAATYSFRQDPDLTADDFFAGMSPSARANNVGD